MDLEITGFLLPFAICLINSTLIRRQVESGKLPALEAAPSPIGLARSSSLRRALVGASVLLAAADGDAASANRPGEETRE